MSRFARYGPVGGVFDGRGWEVLLGADLACETHAGPCTSGGGGEEEGGDGVVELARLDGVPRSQEDDI